MTRRQTLMDGEDHAPVWILVVVMLVGGLLGFWFFKSSQVPHEWSENELRRVAREECAALLDGGQ